MDDEASDIEKQKFDKDREKKLRNAILIDIVSAVLGFIIGGLSFAAAFISTGQSASTVLLSLKL